MTSPTKISSLPFIDLRAQRQALGSRIDDAVARVFDHCQFILGPEVEALESELSRFCGARETVSCANGTDALALVLMAKGVKAGDAILCPSFTFAATAEVVAWSDATAVLVDVEPATFNMAPASLEAGIATARRLGLNPAGVISVDLFGQPADYDAIEKLCAAHGLWLLCDAAQSFGATYKERKVGSIGMATATSFFPAKPLGCYGDGGAIFTDDAELASLIRSLRAHGEGEDKYDNVRIGMNGRLDTVQAAVLIEKLKIFRDEIVSRNAIADRYHAGLSDIAIVPAVREDRTSVWAQYTIRVPATMRDVLAARLKDEGVPTGTYYRKPLHRQTAYRHLPTAGNGLPVSDQLADEVLSLPMHPYLKESAQERIVSAVRTGLEKR